MQIYAARQNGTQKLATIEFAAINDCKAGNTPPPHTITLKIPDATAVYFPSPVTERLKIAPHITDAKNPQSTKKTAFKGILTTPN